MRFAVTTALLAALIALSGCASRKTPAPVVDRPPPPAVTAPAPAAGGATAESRAVQAAPTYTVKRGDTLYSIALDHGVDHRDLAKWNNIADPKVIRIGQVLRVGPEEPLAPVAVAKPISTPSVVEASPIAPPAATAPVSAVTPNTKGEPKGGKKPYSEQALAEARRDAVPPTQVAAVPATPPTVPNAPRTEPKPESGSPAANDSGIDWTWPAGGKIENGFQEAGGKGIDILGKDGDPVFAAASGKVIFVGANIRGYGNLVVVKHNESFLSAYAHNRRILVKQDQTVARGERIAELGDSDTDRPKLHFEIRRNGKPVDPADYLPSRPR